MVSSLMAHVHHCCPKAASLASSSSFPLAAAGSTSGLQWLCAGGHRERPVGDTGGCDSGAGPDPAWSHLLLRGRVTRPPGIRCYGWCCSSAASAPRLPQCEQGFTSSRAVSCALSVGSTSGPAAAQTAVNHCVWLQYKVSLQGFWWVFSCLFFA